MFNCLAGALHVLLTELGAFYQIRGPGVHFSNVPKSFRGRKATIKILNLKFTELLFSHNINTNKINFHAKFNAYTLHSI